MATKILNPFQSVAPDQTVAMAAQIHDEVENKKQSQINAELRGELADLALTSDDLDAIINEVDTDAPYITFTNSDTNANVKAYRHPAGDVTGKVCFSDVNGDKYHILGTYDEEADPPELQTTSGAVYEGNTVVANSVTNHSGFTIVVSNS